jgi:Na+/proline symporter
MAIRIAFSIADYCVFFAMLLMSAAIGFYFAFKTKSNKNVDDFLLGGRKMKVC